MNDIMFLFIDILYRFYLIFKQNKKTLQQLAINSPAQELVRLSFRRSPIFRAPANLIVAVR